jgi:hypothetical protein
MRRKLDSTALELFSRDFRVYDWRDDAIHMIFVAQ